MHRSDCPDCVSIRATSHCALSSLSAEEYLEADALAEEIGAMEPAAEEIRQIQVWRLSGIRTATDMS